ncbi:hypothetical protein L6R49_31435 [Myxococcota bacterium]|nr:hypothetical protein [Myxococcota bacterium]
MRHLSTPQLIDRLRLELAVCPRLGAPGDPVAQSVSQSLQYQAAAAAAPTQAQSTSYAWKAYTALIDAQTYAYRAGLSNLTHTLDELGTRAEEVYIRSGAKDLVNEIKDLPGETRDDIVLLGGLVVAGLVAISWGPGGAALFAAAPKLVAARL